MKKSEETHKRTVLEAWQSEAAGNLPLVPGKALGPSPRFFVIGDVPTTSDLAVGQPFSGPLQSVFEMTLRALNSKGKASAEDLYVTYLVKALYPPRQLTVEKIQQSWLRVAQLEYEVSGCSEVLAVGPVVRQFAGYLNIRAAVPPAPRRGFVERVRELWQTSR